MNKYRPNVCAVLTDAAREQVLLFRRVDNVLGDHRWQFPQGGLNPGESLEQALWRELEEEIGTRDAELLGRLEQPIRYDFPPEVLALRSEWEEDKRGYGGQEQHWFLARLRGGTEAIHFSHQPQEFDAFRWATPAEAVELVVPFKRAAYRAGLRGLGLLGEEEG